MDIIVKSQKDIESYAMQEHKEKSILISIASKCMPSAMVIPCRVNGIKDVLFLNFNDTDCNDLVSGCIEKRDALEIKQFILKHMNDTDLDLIIVQCEAGQSRSAGVAAALMKYLWNDDTAIFNNHKYTPNMLCYRTVLNEFMNDY